MALRILFGEMDLNFVAFLQFAMGLLKRPEFNPGTEPYLKNTLSPLSDGPGTRL